MTYRTTDPQTSVAAAERHDLGKSQRHVWSLVLGWPGKTSSELATIDRCLDKHEIRRRLPELERLGKVHRNRLGTKNGHPVYESDGREARWYPGENPSNQPELF